MKTNIIRYKLLLHGILLIFVFNLQNCALERPMYRDPSSIKNKII